MFLKEFFEIVNFEKGQQTTTKAQHAKSKLALAVDEKMSCPIVFGYDNNTKILGR